MGDMIVKDNLNGFTENCSEMGNTFEIFNKQASTEEEQQIVEDSPLKTEQFKHVNSDARKVITCHKAESEKKSCITHRTQCIASKCDLVNDSGIDISKANFEKLKEVQSNWIELHKCIRFIYKNAISSVPCIVVKEEIPKRITDAVTVLIEKLCEEDCQQLFIRVELLVRDFVLEAKDRLKDLQNNVDDIPVLYLRGLLASYGAFCVAADNLAPYIPQLDSLLMKRFSVNFQLLNKYLFQTCLYADAFVQNNVPLYISQLRTSNSGTHFTNQELVHSYLAFDDEMTDIASTWLDVKKMILKLSKKRVLSNCKQPLLLEDWKLYREHRELAASRTWQLRTVKRDLAEFDVQLLSLLDDITSHMCELEISSNMKSVLSTCRNCNTDILCSCDDCTIKHILSCVETPPASPRRKTENTLNFTPLDFMQDIDSLSMLASNDLIKSEKGSSRSPEQNKGEALNDHSVNTSSHSSCLFPMPSSNKTSQVNQGTEDSNTLYFRNNKVNKIAMPKNFLKLITDKVMTKSFVSTSEDAKDDAQCEPATSRVPTTTVVSTSTTATSSTATSKVPASTSVAISITHSSLAHNLSTTTSTTVSDKQGRILKETTKTTPSKLQCNHTYQAVNKKTTKDTSTSTQQVCKDGCTEHATVNNKSSKESKRCDCPHCEVFESTNAQSNLKNNKTRERLRIRLNEKRNKALTEKNSNPVEIKNTEVEKGKAPENQIVESSTHPAAGEDPRDIRDLINFIEGKDQNQKLINAQKRLAKKARRLERKMEEEIAKEQERQRLEAERLLEEERKLQEQKRLEEEARLKELQQQQAAKKNKKKAKNTGKAKENIKPIKVNGNNNNAKNGSKAQPEQTQYLPAAVTDKSRTQNSTGPMVTIKRVMECTNSEPTVTITLKGSTPDKDKLLYTLVNGQTDIGRTVEETSDNRKSKKDKKKEKQQLQKTLTPSNTNINQPLSKKQRKNLKKAEKQAQIQNGTQKVPIKPDSTNNEVKTSTGTTNQQSINTTGKPEGTLNLQMLRLPPGITITKVDGPAVNRKIKLNVVKVTETTQTTPIQPAESRSGVIVVDTVKLKEVLPAVEQQQVVSSTTPAPNTTNKKKKKKNKNKSENGNTSNGPPNGQQQNLPFAYKISSDVSSTLKTSNTNGNSIVTIKNPMFYQLQESLNGKMNKSNQANNNNNNNNNNKIPEGNNNKEIRSQQASIIKGANGMVTIRSPRLNGGAIPNGHGEPILPIGSVGGPILPDLKPVIGPNTSVFKPIKTENTKPFNAQEILSGLPGIEITKINKNSTRNKHECKVFQPADVSIIPTNVGNGTNGDVYKLFCDNTDWSLESVFAPKDIKEDEVLDADELELEAFKRFCQQSVPPERKEKVAHLNVKDIVLKKKMSSSGC